MNDNYFHILNGQVMDDHESGTLRYNRGFLYGDGFFETMRCENNRILFENLHWQRIRKSSLLLDLDTTTLPTPEQLRWQLESLILQNKLTGAVRARLSIYRNSDGNYNPKFNKAGYLLQVNEVKKNKGVIQKGFKTGIYESQNKAAGALSTIKSLSSQLYVMAAIFAKKNNFDEAIIVNNHGNYIEGISSNLFVVKNELILTPPLSEGCIDGVFRSFLIKTAIENNLLIKEQIITTVDLLTASEIWFTNVIRGIQWADTINHQSYQNNLAKQMKKLIQDKINTIY